MAEASAPLYVTWRDIARFEETNSALRGIGEIMVRRGRWIVTDEGPGATA
jgi:hypothetical protein